MKNKAIKLSSYELKLTKNLRSLIDSRGITINQIAQDLQIPIMTVRRLLTGETTAPRVSTLKLIADYFGVTIDSLIEDNHVSAHRSASTSMLVPIFTWESIEKYGVVGGVDLSNWRDWQPVVISKNTSIGKNAFALESKPSMFPRFPQNTLFIIDPGFKPADGDIVLVKIKNDNTYTLRELIIDPPNWHLYSVIPGNSQLSFSDEKHEIVGVVILTMLYNQRVYNL